MCAASVSITGPESVCGDGPDDGLVFTCEHAGNLIPAVYRELFRADQSLLDSHRGYDPGAMLMARTLARAFSAPLLSSTVSRLLVDLNRSIGHPRLHGEPVRGTPVEVRQHILRKFYRPYRERAERLVMQSIADSGRVVHISSHSFVPELNGKRRRADIGLLYDPTRAGEVDLCRRWKDMLVSRAPEFIVRRNYPYEGKGDGLTAWFRRRLPPRVYVGIELEVNQAQVALAGRHWSAMRQVIVETLHSALVDFRGAGST
ncbi:MAG: N-formylglutamate amidohydrolase [Gammaproteobacteria bacterium]|jgi:predicted N-formylglutamate amidohydrolase|nr:N-formylglutamate amidohydrolase [Gammaproteobacteria bacterium]